MPLLLYCHLTEPSLAANSADKLQKAANPAPTYLPEMPRHFRKKHLTVKPFGFVPMMRTNYYLSCVPMTASVDSPAKPDRLSYVMKTPPKKKHSMTKPAYSALCYFVQERSAQ